MTPMMTPRRLAAWFVVSTACTVAAVALAGPLLPWLTRGRPGGVFQVKPYLQAGDAPDGGGGSLALIWQTADQADPWSVEFSAGSGVPWAETAPPASRRVAVDG